MTDPRKGNSFYYDLDKEPLSDVPFYLRHVTPATTVLELGCGTGRVLVPLAGKCKDIVGIDYSKEMIESCRRKLGGLTNAVVHVGDITNLQLNRKFDLVTAPYRVMQALETDKEVNGLVETIRRHLKAEGHCILNVFHPNREKQQLIDFWAVPGEQVRWKKTLPDGTRIVHSEWYERIDPRTMVLFPHLIYRRYRGDELIAEHKQSIKMRVYYPEEFIRLIESHGFEIVDKWGGYEGQPYGKGKELVVKFRTKTSA